MNPSADKASAGKPSADTASAGKALARRTKFLPTILLPTLLLQTLCPPTALAEAASADLLALGRADHFRQRGQWEAAAAELGRLPKSAYDDPSVRRYVASVVPRLYPERPPTTPWRRAAILDAPRPPGPRAVVQSRATIRNTDAAEHSDQIFDNRGREYNTAFLVEGDADAWRHVLRGAVDGYQDGKNDLRPRQFSYQARTEGIRLTTGDIRQYLTHHKIFDPSNPLSSYAGYTLPATQLRGVDVQLTTERNDFHLMAGAAPYFLSPSDEYIYPRTIAGIRESYKVTPWYRAALGASYVRDDDERTEHVNTATQPRETGIMAFEQDLTLIPGHWEVNTEHAYSVTDDNLKPDRFGNNVKLKDFAHHVFSEWRWPAVRVLGAYERVGPDFRAPSDIGATSLIKNQTVSADREHLALRIYPRPLGRLFGNVFYTRTRNNLDNDSEIAQTREHWLTAEGGLRLPDGWPQPGGRATFIRTISVPGSRFGPAFRWAYDLSGELRKRWWETEWTGGYHYWQADNDAETGFDDEYRRTWLLQASRGLWPGAYVSTRGAVTRAQDLFNNTTMRRRTEREANITWGTRLWSPATISAGYTYRDLGAPFIVEPAAQSTADGGIIHTVSSSLLWPITATFWRGRRLSVTPSVHFFYSDASDDRERHPDIGARMTARYAVRDDWRVEFMLEHRQDDDGDILRVRSQEWRGWLVVTSKFGSPLRDESTFR